MLLDRFSSAGNAAWRSSLCTCRRKPALNGTQPRNPPLLTPSATSHLPCINYTPVRHATHAAQGRANGPKNGPGKRLGAKVTGDSYVIPGHIIFRQRGTQWHPGHNVSMGRDHTIYATQPGFVKYYRDPTVHPKRRYIGVVFDKTDKLPYPATMPRKRRLGMLAVPRQLTTPPEPASSELSLDTPGKIPVDTPAPVLTKAQQREARRRTAAGHIPVSELTASAPTYAYRESNTSIGRAAERAGVKVTPFKRGDRWLAWRKRSARAERAAERRALVGQKSGKSDKKKGKGRPKAGGR